MLQITDELGCVDEEASSRLKLLVRDALVAKGEKGELDDVDYRIIAATEMARQVERELYHRAGDVETDVLDWEKLIQ